MGNTPYYFNRSKNAELAREQLRMRAVFTLLKMSRSDNNTLDVSILISDWQATMDKVTRIIAADKRGEVYNPNVEE